MGALYCLSNFCTLTNTSTRTKRRSMQTVEIKVKMDCDGCERKVKNAVKKLRGVKTVEINRKQSRVTVSGYVDPNKVLKSVKNTGKGAEFWPYIPYNRVQYPHVSQVYDKKAPEGYVRNVQAVPVPNATEDTFAYLFSDDNPTACSIM
ncbi:UNVERIFIED_CONTAM: Heavy metal-associated isoprenylated plant protein 21 [Sesamum calycinum]|uniref:Heavy metal-associated isoprenylated plant protein 21 n=2 Tax=Sesamum TaxID=4181 RepID=A0AAW2SWF5_9LAMI